MTKKQIVLNRIRTPDGTLLTSYHVHDYQTYIDKNGLEYMVDGGNEYLRRTVHKSFPYEEMSVYAEDPYELVRCSFHRGGRGKNGDEPLKWVPMSEMSDEWLKACIVYNEERGLKGCFANSMYQKELDYRKEKNIVIND